MIKEKLGIPPRNVFLVDIHRGQALHFAIPRASYDVQSSSYKCIQPSVSILTHTHTHTRATYYALSMTKTYTGLTMGAESDLHLNCRDKDIGQSITINDHIMFYSTIKSHI